MPTCFIIGPIGDKFAPAGSPARQTYEDALEVLEDVIQAACESLAIDPIRADQIALSGDITEQVFRHLREDDVVIADVSGGNSNVMYELGLRHTTGKLTIQIGEYGQLPFDIQAIRTIQFSRSRKGLIDARKELTRALEVGLTLGQDPLTATTVWQNSIESVVPATPSDLPDQNVDDDVPGLLENMAEVEYSMAAMTEDALKVSESIENIGTVTQALALEMERVTREDAPTSLRLAVVARLAEEIKRPSDSLEQHSINFSKNMEKIDNAITPTLKYLSSSEDELPPELFDFLTQIISLAEVTREGMGGLSSFGSAAEGLGSLSRQLRGPGKKIKAAVLRMSGSASRIDEWERLARNIGTDNKKSE